MRARFESQFFRYPFLNCRDRTSTTAALSPATILSTMITALKFKLVNWTILLSTRQPIYLFLGWLLNLTWFASSLGTDTEYVRSRLAEYANDLLSLGVDGFRLDAAKSKGLNKIKSWWPYVESLLDIAATDIANITSRFSSSKIYITQEVIFGAGQPILPSEYVGIGEFSVHPC